MNEDDDSEFAGMISGVRRLRSDRINQYGERQRPEFSRRDKDDADITQTQYRIEQASARDSYFKPGIQKKLERKIRQGAIRHTGVLDLHGYRQTEALDALNQFINQCIRQQDRMVLIIHGQGYRSPNEAVLKPLVHRWLASQSRVLAWCPAQPRDGAAGASYVYLQTGLDGDDR